MLHYTSTFRVMDALLAQTSAPPPGPWYVETNRDLFIVEPFNAASALLFILLGVFWVWRLRGQYRRHAFLAACMPLVFIGGIGGTVFHAFRGNRIWMLMDVLPIAILCLAVGVYLWSKLLRRWWHGLLIVPIVVGATALVFVLPRTSASGMHWRIAFNYCLLGSVILAPAVLVLTRTHWRGGAWPAAALACFALAVTCRQIDAAVANGGYWGQITNILPMGTHFLWHVLGALACNFTAEYLYRLPGALNSITKPD